MTCQNCYDELPRDNQTGVCRECERIDLAFTYAQSDREARMANTYHFSEGPGYDDPMALDIANWLNG